MPYTDNYERNTHGIIAFWIRNHFEHGRFFDREISHHELELAKENAHVVERLGTVLKRAQNKSDDLGNLIDDAYQATCEFRDFLRDTLDKHLQLKIIISTPHLLLDHMIREAEEALLVLKLLRSGNNIPAAEASVHENAFWLRIMSDHVSFIRHYSDPMNYEFNEKINQMIRSFNDLFLQANVFKSMTHKPRTEMYPSIVNFNRNVINRTKDLEKLKLELASLIKERAILTTAPLELLEHVAREAHHFYKNLEEQVIS